MIQLIYRVGAACIICMIQDRFPGLDLYYTGPAQHRITASQDLVEDLDDVDDLNGDTSTTSTGGGNAYHERGSYFVRSNTAREFVFGV